VGFVGECPHWIGVSGDGHEVFRYGGILKKKSGSRVIEEKISFRRFLK